MSGTPSSRAKSAEWTEKPQRVQSFQDLVAWQKAMDLVDMVYRITAGFPRSEIFGLRSQMRRAAVSIPSNIAEGYARRRPAEYLRFLDISRGSLAELQTQSIVCQRQKMIGAEVARELFPLMEDVSRLLFRLAESVQKSIQ